MSSLLMTISLYLFASYHMLVGLPSVLSLAWLRKTGSLLYKLKIPQQPDPQFEYVLKPLGLYAIFVSLVSFAVARSTEPNFQANYLLICAALLIGRGSCRIAYSELFIRAFGTTPMRNRANALLTFALGAWLVAVAAMNR